jgi:hypothetical protein
MYPRFSSLHLLCPNALYLLFRPFPVLEGPGRLFYRQQHLLLTKTLRHCSEVPVVAAARARAHS